METSRPPHTQNNAEYRRADGIEAHRVPQRVEQAQRIDPAAEPQQDPDRAPYRGGGGHIRALLLDDLHVLVLRLLRCRFNSRPTIRVSTCQTQP
jgi:hypothetical protein